MKQKPYISVIIPVYGAPGIIPVLYERLVKALAPWADYELVMVNDACPQGSGQVVENLALNDSRVVLVDLIRNYGQHVAISAGLDYASGDFAVVMDCDLQDQPEEIKKMYDLMISGGYDVVFGIREKRQDAVLKRLRSVYFRKFYNYLVGDISKTTNDTDNFSIINRPILNAYRCFAEKKRLYGGILANIASKIGYVNVCHAPRYEGKSSYTLMRNLRLAIYAIVSNTNKPLYITVYCAVGLFAFALILGFRVIYNYLVYGINVVGWASLMTIICFFSGLQMLF